MSSGVSIQLRCSDGSYETVTSVGASAVAETWRMLKHLEEIAPGFLADGFLSEHQEARAVCGNYAMGWRQFVIARDLGLAGF